MKTKIKLTLNAALALLFALSNLTVYPFIIQHNESDEDYLKTAESAGQTLKKPANGELKSRLDDYLSTVSALGFSGSIMIVKEGEILLHKGYGFADRENSAPNTKDTVFDIGSITKQFTAAAIMKLEMQGKLNTNDFLGKYLPDVPADKAEITLHQILTHTAGLANYSGDDYEVSLRDETVKRILTTPLESKPGEKYAYSNAGYTLLAVIVERISGEPYEKFLRRHLFEPAKMKMTGYRLAEWKRAQLPRGYNDGKNLGTPLDHKWAESGPYWNLFGNGGMLSTVGDLYKWSQALKGETILSAAAKQKLFTPNLNNYAYGWRVENTPFGKRISHGGASDNGFISNFQIFPEKDTVIVIATNRITMDDFLLSRRIVNRIALFVFGGALPDFPALKKYKAVLEKLKRFEGTYQLPSGEKFLVKAHDDLLSVEPEGQKAISALAFAAGTATEDYANFNSRASEIVGGVIKENYEPLQSELKDAAAAERWQKTFARWQTEWKEQGKVTGHELLGTVPTWWEEEKSSATFVRLQMERGSKVFRLFWRDGKLHSLGRGGVENPAAFRFAAQSETEFVGYHIELANAARVRFDLSETGEVNGLTLTLKGEKIIARKTS